MQKSGTWKHTLKSLVVRTVLGNVEENESESVLQTKEKVGTIQIGLYVTRLGKPTPSKRRLLLVKMKCFEDKLTVYSGLFFEGSGVTFTFSILQ